MICPYYIVAVTGILNIIFSVILGRKLGVFGILFATFIARACTNLWYDPYAVFKHGFHRHPIQYLKKYIVFTFTLLIAALACYFSLKLVSGPIIVRVVMEIIICSIVTNIVFLCAFWKTREFGLLKRVIANIFSILKRKR